MLVFLESSRWGGYPPASTPGLWYATSVCAREKPELYKFAFGASLLSFSSQSGASVSLFESGHDA
jgi:hypothetical protein